MPTTTPKRRLSRGHCYLCGQEFSKNSIAKHLDKCWETLTATEKYEDDACQPTRFFRLVVEAPYIPDYWLHLDVRADSTLEDLDDFLRRIWLECCGHLSAFTIGEKRYDWRPPGGFGDDTDSSEYRMEATLADTLSPDVTFTYEYDLGDTTDLKLRVLSEHEEPLRRKSLRLLARNDAPVFPCAKCGQKADWIGLDGESYEPLTICNTCLEENEMDDSRLLPLVNSPRTGVCGYTGVLED